MAEMIIVEPFALSYLGDTLGAGLLRGSGSSNVLEPDPREVWLDGGAAEPYYCFVDLGGNTDWDTLALVNVTAASGATWTITGGAAYDATVYKAASAMKLPSEDGEIATAPALYHNPAGNNGRYIRVMVTPGAMPINSIGCLVVGKSWKPTQPREQGAGRPPQDSGVRTRLDNGGLATVPGHLLSGLKWVFGDLDLVDLRKLWGIMRRRRTTEPMLLVEDWEEGYAEGFHYGTFVDLDLFERRDASKSRWALSFEDWL